MRFDCVLRYRNRPKLSRHAQPFLQVYPSCAHTIRGITFQFYYQTSHVGRFLLVRKCYNPNEDTTTYAFIVFKSLHNLRGEWLFEKTTISLVNILTFSIQYQNPTLGCFVQHPWLPACWDE